MHLLDVFSQEEVSQHICLQKIEEYHNETGETIYVSGKKPYPHGCPREKYFLRTIQQELPPSHVQLVKEYLSQQTLETAKKNHMRNCYHEMKWRILFLETAIQEIQKQDPFYLTVEDVDELNCLITDMIFKKLYYQEHM